MQDYLGLNLLKLPRWTVPCHLTIKEKRFLFHEKKTGNCKNIPVCEAYDFNYTHLFDQLLNCLKWWSVCL